MRIALTRPCRPGPTAIATVPDPQAEHSTPNAFSLPATRTPATLCTLLLALCLLPGCSFLRSKIPGYADDASAQNSAYSDPRAANYADDSVSRYSATGSDPNARSSLEQQALARQAAAEANATRLRHQQTLDALAQTPGLTNQDYWARISREFSLDRNHREVQQWANYYAGQAERIRGFIAEGSPYLWHVEQQLRRRGMPLELVLLPVLESGYNPHAVSSSGAVGLWQFLPATGERFGLHTDWWFDGRRDFIGSTAAAMEYLQFLHEKFDDWLLAIAAYNCGEGCMARAMRDSRSRDFWSTDLPRQTDEYVPKLLGLAALVSDPSRYGFYMQPQPDGPQTEIVQLAGQIEFAQAARYSGTDVTVLKALNAGFRRDATAPSGPHRILVPAEQAPALRAALGGRSVPQLASHASTPATRHSTGYATGHGRHRVSAGETLTQISRRYGTHPQAIQQANNLSGSLIHVGQELVIPAAGQQVASVASAPSATMPLQTRPANSGQHIVHQVAAGDTIWYVARLYSVTSQNIVSWNNLNPDTPLRPGQLLHIHKQVGSVENDAVFYQVRAGDSLIQIASRFGVSAADIRRWNILEHDRLQPGQRLKILRSAYIHTDI